MHPWTAEDDELVARRGDGRVLFRLVHSETTNESDWRSHYELGAPPRRSEIGCALDHMSLSFWDNPEVLVRLIERPRLRAALGSFIVEVAVEPALGIWLAETNSKGHFSVWGRPADFQRAARLPAQRV